MGILFSRPSGSQKFNKFKQIGGSSGQKILKKMDYADRAKLKGFVKGIGSQRVSIQKAAKAIGDEHGSVLKNKFLTAAEKHYSGGLTEKQRERNIKTTMAKDEILGQVGGGEKGSAAKRFGLKDPNTGFAGQKKQNVSSPNPIPKKPAGGFNKSVSNLNIIPPRSGGGGTGIPLSRVG